ncbi:hypothetical protein [Mycobacterium lepromatosis]|uniref:hypothetical protein n=1 Tax=Mycobacterium lepromatosis TaxID=480418 RepID=UPI0005F7DAA7|nr:hypothetical protein [Mycobacterium lepromatosis]
MTAHYAGAGWNGNLSQANAILAALSNDAAKAIDQTAEHFIGGNHDLDVGAGDRHAGKCALRLRLDVLLRIAG